MPKPKSTPERSAKPRAAKPGPARKPRSTRKPRTAGVSAGVAAWSIGVALVGLGAAVVGVLLRRTSAPRPQLRAGGAPAQPPLVAPASIAKGPANLAEHAAPDLAPDRPAPDAQSRAPDAFRPDATAPVPPELRESLRPATASAPGFAADRGTTVTGG